MERTNLVPILEVNKYISRGVEKRIDGEERTRWAEFVGYKDSSVLAGDVRVQSYENLNPAPVTIMSNFTHDNFFMECSICKKKFGGTTAKTRLDSH